MTYRCEIFFTTERVIRCDLQYELFVEALFKSIFTISLLTGPVGLPVLSLFYPCAACGVRACCMVPASEGEYLTLCVDGSCAP